MNIKDIIYLLVLLILGVVFRFYIAYFLPIENIKSENLLITNLLNQSFLVPWQAVVLVGLINVLLLWDIVRRKFNKSVAAIAATLYLFSCWTAYLEVAGSTYILLACLLLMSLWSFILSFTKREWLYLSLGCLVGLLYINLLLWPVVLPAIFYIIWQSKNNKLLIGLLFVTIIPLVFISFYNKTSFMQNVKNEVSIFANIGLINTVNDYRGEVNKSNFSLIGKVVENKYTYLAEHTFYNILKSFSPATYFNPQERLLGSSVTPPIFVAVLIPFIFGLYKLLREKKIKKILVCGLLLIIPSVLAKVSPDLNRLVIFSPLIFITSAFGVGEFMRSRNRISKIFLYTFCFIFIFQFLLTLFDIANLESLRLKNL